MSRWQDYGFPDIECVPTYRAIEGLYRAWMERCNVIGYGHFDWSHPLAMELPSVSLRRLIDSILTNAGRTKLRRYPLGGLWMCDIDNGDINSIRKGADEYKGHVLEVYGIDMDDIMFLSLRDVVIALYRIINSIRLGFPPWTESSYMFRNDETSWEWERHYGLSSLGVHYNIFGKRYYDAWTFDDCGFYQEDGIGALKGSVSEVERVFNIDAFRKGDIIFAPVTGEYSGKSISNPLHGIPFPAEDGISHFVNFAGCTAIVDYSSEFEFYDPPEG